MVAFGTLFKDVLNDAINEPGCTIVDVRNAEELVADGNLGAMGAENYVNIPKDQLEQAIKLTAEEFQVNFSSKFPSTRF